MQKRPTFILVTVAAKVTDTSLVFHSEGVVPVGKDDTTGNSNLTSEVFYHIHVILSLKLKDRKGFTTSEEDPACCSLNADSDPWTPEPSSRLLLDPDQSVLVSALQRLVWHQPPQHARCDRLGNSVLVLHILHYFSYYSSS